MNEMAAVEMHLLIAPSERGGNLRHYTDMHCRMSCNFQRPISRHQKFTQKFYSSVRYHSEAKQYSSVDIFVFQNVTKYTENPIRVRLELNVLASCGNQ